MGLLTTSFTEELLLLNSGKGEISRVKYLSYVYIFFCWFSHTSHPVAPAGNRYSVYRCLPILLKND